MKQLRMQIKGLEGRVSDADLMQKKIVRLMNKQKYNVLLII